MARDTYYERIFKCIFSKCKSTREKLTEKRYKWASDNTKEYCLDCGHKMIEVIPVQVNAPTIGKFANMTPAQRQQVLKKRSHEHFKKHIADKKYEMNRAYVQKNKNP